MAVTHPQPLTHANLKVTAQPWAQASSISFSDNFRSLELTNSDTPNIASIRVDVIALELGS